VRFSGALPATEVRAMLERVTKLREAVKMAREAANGIETTDQHVGEAVLGYLFG
jgi:thioredoxin-like negative regulator of GroEL